MAYTAWRGALEITISGFPVPVPVVFNPRTGAAKSNSGLSLLSPDGRPVFQRYVTDDEGWSGTIGQCARGKDGIKLDDQVVAQLADSERDRLVTPHSFAPLESIDLSIAQGSYAVVPDEQAAGASRQLEVLWNGLRSTGLAYITQIVLRGGSPDRTFAIYADDAGLWAAAMPFANEIKPAAGLGFEANDQVGAMFATAIEASYEIKPFDAAEHVSQVQERRQQLIEAALAGKQIPAPAEPKADAETPDLMALLTQSVQAVGKPKPKRKARKPKAKAAA